MKSKLIDDASERTFAVVFDSGDEAIAGLTAFAKEHRLKASHFTGIGAFREAILGYFDWTTKDYKRITVDEQVEVLSLIGDVALKDGTPVVHAHVVLGKSDGTAHGGHLLSGIVRPTLEIVLEESPAHLRRTLDHESGLPLINLTA
jgi:predicted DNA-binding protein with PD1-like motif